MPTREVIGLIPCGGLASRIAPLPCSKEILPVGLLKTADGLLRPKVVSHYLLEKLRQGGVRKAFVILRNGKEHRFSPAEIPGHRYAGRIAAGVHRPVALPIGRSPNGMNYTAADLMPF